MAINTQELFDFVKRPFQRGDSDEDFVQAFFYALTRTINDLESPSVGLTIGDVPTDIQTDINADASYFNVIVDGMFKYIQDMPEYRRDEFANVDTIYERSLNRAHTLYRNSITAYARLGRDTSSEEEDDEEL